MDEREVSTLRLNFLQRLGERTMTNPIELNPSDLDLVLVPEINSFLIDRPAARDRLVRHLVESRVKRDRVIYIDLDTAFSARLRISKQVSGNLTLITPKEDQLEDALLSLLSWTEPKLGLLILDSISTFNHILGDHADFSSRNRKLGYYLSLMRDFVSRAGAQMVITSHWGYRRTVSNDWTRRYAGGRVLEYQSSNIFSTYSDGSIILHVIKSTEPKLRGKSFRLLESLEAEQEEPQHETDRDKKETREYKGR